MGFYRPQRIHTDENECTSCRGTLLDTRIHKSQVSDQWETWLYLFQMVWNYCCWCERGSRCRFLIKWEYVSVTTKRCSSEHVFLAFLTIFSNAPIILPDNLFSILAIIFILEFFFVICKYTFLHIVSWPKSEPFLCSYVAKTLGFYLSSVTALASCLALTLLSIQNQCCCKTVFCSLTSSCVYMLHWLLFYTFDALHKLSLPSVLYRLRFFLFAGSADHLYHSQAKPSCLVNTPCKYKNRFWFCCKDALCFWFLCKAKIWVVNKQIKVENPQKGFLLLSFACLNT